MSNTITPKFREQVESGLGGVIIFAGSGSDDKERAGGKPSHIETLCDCLAGYGVPYEVRIASAHKQPGKVLELAAEYDCITGALVYIAVAGGTDALSGTLAFYSTRPVISCPPDAPNTTCLTNPPGSSNLSVAIPSNAARAAVQILAQSCPDYKTRLLDEITGKLAQLEAADATIHAKYAGSQNT